MPHAEDTGCSEHSRGVLSRLVLLTICLHSKSPLHLQLSVFSECWARTQGLELAMSNAEACVSPKPSTGHTGDCLAMDVVGAGPADQAGSYQ